MASIINVSFLLLLNQEPSMTFKQLSQVEVLEDKKSLGFLRKKKNLFKDEKEYRLQILKESKLLKENVVLIKWHSWEENKYSSYICEVQKT